MSSSLLIFPGSRLSAAELSAARLDGAVIDVGEGFLPSYVAVTPAVRAASLRPLLRPGWLLCGPSAAWVHGARQHPPAPHHVHRLARTDPGYAAAHAQRRRWSGLPRSMHPSARIIRRALSLTPADIVLLAGVPVTTPMRTAQDLSRSRRNDPAEQAWYAALRALIRSGH